MISTLRHGKIPTPTSRESAVRRCHQLIYEIKRIQRQLADLERSARYENGAYEKWRLSATRALELFQEEERQLSAWIASHDASDSLFHQAYNLLKNLELEVEFEVDETALMVRLDQHFEKQEQKGERHDQTHQ